MEEAMMSRMLLAKDLTFVQEMSRDDSGDVLSVEGANVFVRQEGIIVSPGEADDPRAKIVQRPKSEVSVERETDFGQPNMGVFVRAGETQNTGGGVFCDVFLLDEGDVVVISEDAVGCYSGLRGWLDSSIAGWYDGVDLVFL